jgi:hypothetical protein
MTVNSRPENSGGLGRIQGAGPDLNAGLNGFASGVGTDAAGLN